MTAGVSARAAIAFRTKMPGRQIRWQMVVHREEPPHWAAVPGRRCRPSPLSQGEKLDQLERGIGARGGPGRPGPRTGRPPGPPVCGCRAPPRSRARPSRRARPAPVRPKPACPPRRHPPVPPRRCPAGPLRTRPPPIARRPRAPGGTPWTRARRPAQRVRRTHREQAGVAGDSASPVVVGFGAVAVRPLPQVQHGSRHHHERAAA